MKEGPFKVEAKGSGKVINAPGMIITSDKTGRVSVGIDAVAAQLNRAHEAGRIAKRKEDDDLEVKLSDTHKEQRDGWKVIAEALIAIGMGYQMRGFGDNPPREIIDDLLGKTETVTGPEGKTATIETPPRADGEILESIRDSLVGRAWRVAGSEGKGTCDYPLCPNRATKRTPTAFITVPITNGAKLHTCNGNPIKTTHPGAADEVNECHRWAQWVAARAAAGRIEVIR